MKINIYKVLIVAILAIVFVSCKKSFLDKQPDDQLSLDDVFAQQTETEKYLANVYSYLPPLGNGTAMESYTANSDEADLGFSGVPANYMNNIGNWGPTGDVYGDMAWNPLYRGIRSASTFISRIDGNPQMSAQLKAQRKSEARVLRAYYYFLLIRQYGPVPLIKEALPIDVDPSDLQQPRAKFDDIVNFIVSELDLAMPGMVVRTTDNTQLGRIDQLVTKAIKARTLLYAASPLFNGNTDYATLKNRDGTQLFNQVYDVNKWKLAANAAKTVIDAMPAGLYNPYPNDPMKSYQYIFLDRWNSETIFGRRPKNDYLNWHWLGESSPAGSGGTVQNGATQQMVDAYFMANGQRPITGYNADGSPVINAASGYTEAGFLNTAKEGSWKAGISNMYVNREPRFYATISFNGSEWVNKGNGTVPIYFEIWNNGADVRNNDHYSKPGYVIRKFIHPNSIWDANQSLRRWENLIDISFRLTEFYLNYAEALNEVEPGHADILKYLNLIRQRAGIPQYGSAELPIPAGQLPMREAIRAERRIELSFEQHRMWDVRRWKIAEQTDNGPFYGINVKGGNSLSDPQLYKRVVFENRVFLKKHLLWPMPQSEMDKNRQLVQNTGW